MSRKFLILFIYLLSITTFAKVTITTSGGVALGAYKGGYHQYLIEFLKLNKIKVSNIGGASAGGINSYLSLDNYCNPENPKNFESSYWDLWVNLGINDLYSPDKVTATSLFNRDSTEKVISKLEEKFNRGYPKSCNIVLTIPVTSLKIFNNFNHEKVYSPSIKNYFAIRLKGNGLGKIPTLTNVNLHQSTNAQLFLPFSKEAKNNFSLLRKVLYATSAFPIAFSPVSIPVCQGKSVKSCKKADAKERYYVDGGILDNAPLDLTEIYIKDRFPKTYKKDIKHIYVNTSNFSFTKLNPETDMHKANSSIASLLGYQLFNLLEVLRDYEEEKMFETDISVVERTQVGSSILPPISSPLYAFFGFFEKDFREFDFYLGEHDSKFLLEKYYKNATFPKLKNNPLNTCLNVLRKAKVTKKEKLDCQKSYQIMDKNIQALFKVSIQKANTFCHDPKVKSIKRFKEVCYFYHNNKIADLTDNNLYDVESKKNTSSELGIIIDSLSYYDFDFKDLNKKYSSIRSPKTKIYKNMHSILSKFETKQPDDQQTILNLIDTKILETIDTVPPETLIFTNIGTEFEVGVSKMFLQLDKRISFVGSVYIDGLVSYLGREDIETSITPTIGFNVDTFGFSTLDSRLGLGYQIGMKHRKSAKAQIVDCSYTNSTKNCKGAVHFGNISFKLYRRVNLKLSLGYYHKNLNSIVPSFSNILLGFNFF